MEPVPAPCPSESELSRLLSGEAVWQDLALPRHLMLGCSACWDWLERKASHLNPSAVPCAEPLSMAVMVAAMARDNVQEGRFQLMRPLHTADAEKASRDPLAFCRLVLHETLPAGLQAPKNMPRRLDLAGLAETGHALVESTTTQLLSAVQPLTTPEERRDVQAVGLTYRAVLSCWATRLDEAATFLETAYHELAQAHGTDASRVFWHAVAATRERMVGLQGGPSRIRHLQIALGHLAAALESLPATGARLQRAELLHDVAQVHLALDDPPKAMEYLETAWDLITRQQAGGLFLGSLVRLAQVQGALTMAKAQPLASTRQRWATRAESYLAEVQAFGLIEAAEWSDAAQDIAACLDQPVGGNEHGFN